MDNKDFQRSVDELLGSDPCNDISEPRRVYDDSLMPDSCKKCEHYGECGEKLAETMDEPLTPLEEHELEVLFDKFKHYEQTYRMLMTHAAKSLSQGQHFVLATVLRNNLNGYLNAVKKDTPLDDDWLGEWADRVTFYEEEDDG